MALLDTSALIDLQLKPHRKHGLARNRNLLLALQSAALRSDELTASRLSIAELEVGVALSTAAVLERRSIESVRSLVRIIDVDDDVCREYGKLVAELRLAGTPIGPFDSLIAATARYYGEVLVTHNAKHFLRVSGLAIVSY